MTLLQALRGATTRYHENLHIHPALRDLAGENVTLPYFTASLCAFYGFYAPLELRYAAGNSLLKNDFPPGAVTARLEHDLRRRGVKPSGLPCLSTSDAPMGDEESLAYLYLREGSNLGGKFISKNLLKHLALAPDVDNSFFWGHGQDTGRNWQIFLKTLTQMEPIVDTGKTAAFAADFFKTLDHWLSREE